MATRAGETIFLDTNVLLAATDESRDFHETARRLAARGRAAGLPGAWSGQVVREYLAVATRPPEANGLGLTVDEALRNVEQFGGRLAFCDETEATSVRLRGLVRVHGLTGNAVHDANVVATMVAHGISRLVTQNREDFARFPELDIAGLADLEASLDGPAQGR